MLPVVVSHQEDDGQAQAGQSDVPAVVDLGGQLHPALVQEVRLLVK